MDESSLHRHEPRIVEAGDETRMTDAGAPHWWLTRDDEDIAYAGFDLAGSATNVLTRAAMESFGALLTALEASPPKALIIASAKPAGFIAGADIEEFTQITTTDAARAVVQRGWDLFNRLAAVRFPTLALIRGHCMGGGLELVLACRYRVAVDVPDTRLALPEVMLGIMPAWGGMKRLPELIGPASALDLMLTGKGVNAKKAKRLGLVDACVPPRVMDNAARMMATSGAPAHRPEFMQRLMLQPALRGIVAAQARKKVARKAPRAHYPAPYAILDIWSKHDGNALAVPAGDPASLDAILNSSTAQNLLRVFFLQERLKRFGKDSDFAPRRVHVVGAGTMGGDIAAWCALRGMTVTLQDQTVERIAPAIGRATKLYERKHRGDAKQVRFTLDRLIPDPDGAGVASADVIIEAIFEDLEVKRGLFVDIERRARPDAVLATNTSSLRLEDIATVLENPSRLIGIHFFNPVAKLPLVEVVRGEQSDDDTVKRAAAFVRQIDKLPLPVNSAPGFLVNAVLGPYMLEALRCVDEGIAPETIDAALKDFGMAMGPVELADTVGLDIAMAAGKALAGDAADDPPRCLINKVESGRLGKKSGQGFYAWEDGKAQKDDAGTVPVGLAERIIEPMLTAAQRCVAEGVVADAELADAGVIFGAGFAPFRGGPLNYLATRERAMNADAPVADAPATLP